MNVKKARRIRDILFIIGIIIMLFGLMSEMFLIIGGLVMVLGLIFHLAFNRCPHCGKYLGKENGMFCESCGSNVYTGK